MNERSIFATALDITDATERAGYLHRACGGDEGLRRHVEGLLAAQGGLGSFLNSPAVAPDQTGVYEPRVESPGNRIGPYKLLQEIGEGGMGTVFMAEQEVPIRRVVAVKVIRAGMDSKGILVRFEAERQALAMMDHPNIAKVLDAGTTDSGSPYFIMELVKGVPITKFCDENQLSLRERLELFIPVCQAIQHAHMKGVIHRDIKPSNVLVAMYDDHPVPKVIDFGVAKATSQRLTEKTLFTAFGAVVGTLEYMSPEQAKLNQLDIDTRSAVYSRGVLLYELLAGSTPLDRAGLKTAALDEVLRVIREEEPPRPSQRLSAAATLPQIAAARKSPAAQLGSALRGELDWIVMRCLEKDRVRRYETATSLAQDVERYLSGDSVEACPPTWGYRLRKAYRRNRAAVWVAAAFALVLLAATAVSVTFGVQARRQRDELRHTLIQKTADEIRADLHRLRLAGTALAAMVPAANDGDERQYIDAMVQILKAEPEILGLCIAFEPNTFAPANSRPPKVDPADPNRDGYSLHVRREPGAGLAAGPLPPKYCYRTQQWYKLARGGFVGWEEPTFDTLGQMVSFVRPLQRPTDSRPIGALCVDLSATYFHRLQARLAGPHFGPGSYAFVLSREGKVIAHPHLPAAPNRPNSDPEFPTIKSVWPRAAVFEKVLADAGEKIEQVADTDPATDRPSRFLFLRFQPVDWVLVVVIPDGE